MPQPYRHDLGMPSVVQVHDARSNSDVVWRVLENGLRRGLNGYFPSDGSRFNTLESWIDEMRDLEVHVMDLQLNRLGQSKVDLPR